MKSRNIAIAAIGGALLVPVVSVGPANAAPAPDVCHLQIVPGHNSDRISRVYIPHGKPKHGQTKKYIMVGVFRGRTFCSTHHYVQGANHAAAAHYTFPNGKHPIHGFSFINGITTTRTTKEGQLVIETDYIFPLECSRRAGKVKYFVRFVGSLEGSEPAQYRWDNVDSLDGRTHEYNFLCGHTFYATG